MMLVVLSVLLTCGCSLPSDPAEPPILNPPLDDTTDTGQEGRRGPVILNEDFTARQVFPANNWWNMDISDAPVDPDSDSFIAFHGGYDLRVDFGQSPYGIPYVGVGGDQPLVPVEFLYADESDPGAPGRPPGYPLPDEAFLLPGYIEGGVAGGGSGGDCHLLVIDRDNWLLFETWSTSWNAGSGLWEAGSGVAWDLSSNAQRPEGWVSTMASGLALYPGLVKYDEFVGAEPIGHAFGVRLSSSNGHVWPASRSTGSAAGALPLGARLRLRANADISGFSPAMQRIFQAMKTHGLIFADIGSSMYVPGTMDERWNPDDYALAFRSFHIEDFEVVLRGWQPMPTGVPRG
jgi:hypothetical protein